MTETPAKSAPTPPPASPTPAKPKATLPVPLVIGVVGAALFVIGAFLPYYNLDQPGAPVPQIFQSVSGKIAILLVLVAVLLVAIKQLGTLAVAAVALATGPALRSVIDVASGDDVIVKLSAGSAGIGMYAALIGGAILLLAAFIPAKKKSKK